MLNLETDEGYSAVVLDRDLEEDQTTIVPPQDNEPQSGELLEEIDQHVKAERYYTEMANLYGEHGAEIAGLVRHLASNMYEEFNQGTNVIGYPPAESVIHLQVGYWLPDLPNLLVPIIGSLAQARDLGYKASPHLDINPDYPKTLDEGSFTMNFRPSRIGMPEIIISVDPLVNRKDLAGTMSSPLDQRSGGTLLYQAQP